MRDGQFSRQLDARSPAELDVEQHAICVELGRRAQELFCRGERADAISGDLEESFERLEYPGFVIDDRDRLVLHCHFEHIAARSPRASKSWRLLYV